MRKRISWTVAAVLAAAAAAPNHARADDAAWRGLTAGADDAGRLRWWYSGATGRETRRLDAHGRVLQRRFANGDTWSWRYDKEGRPVEAIAASASSAWRTSIEWHGNGVRRVLHPHENETRLYDTHGRLASRLVHRPALSARESEFSYREDFAWDAAGRRLRHDLPEGGSLMHEHDTQGRVVRIEWRERRRRKTLLPLADHGSDPHINGGASAAPPILRQRLHHDPQGRLWGRHLQIGAWQAAWAYAYGADTEMIGAALRLRGVTAPQARPQDGDAPAMHAPSQRRWMYAWRPSGAALATRADSQTLRHDVQRDASGLPARAGRRLLEYGPDRRLRRLWENDRLLACYVHNAHGQRIRRQDAAGTRHYLYVQDHYPDAQRQHRHGQDHYQEARGRYAPGQGLGADSLIPLASDTQPGSALHTSGHPGLRTRHRMVAEARPLPDGAVGVTRRYVYAGDTPIAIIEYPQPRPLAARPSAAAGAPSPGSAWSHAAGSPSGAISAPASGSAAGTALSSAKSLPVFHTVHTDAYGVPYAVTDSSLRIRWRAVVSPTGAPVAEEGDLPMPLRGPGHVRDEASGWHDSGLRTYDPQAGHYLEPDPAGPMAGGSPYGYPGVAGKEIRPGTHAAGAESAAADVQSRAAGARPQSRHGRAQTADTQARAAQAFPRGGDDNSATAQVDAVSADMRGYGKWLREALAPEPPPLRGGGRR